MVTDTGMFPRRQNLKNRSKKATMALYRHNKGENMENKSGNGVKNAIFFCLVFIGILIGVVFISTTILILCRFSTDFIVEKGLIFSILLSFILTTVIRYKRSHKKNNLRYNLRYWLSFILFFAGIIGTVLMEGGKLLTLIDIPGIIIIGIVPLLFVSILCGFKEMVMAFSIQSINDPDKETLKKSSRFFEMYGKVILISGVISVIIGIINMLTSLDDKNSLGPNLALALISIFYSCIIYVLIIIPYSMFIKNKLNE